MKSERIITEIKQDIKDKILSLTYNVQILRDDNGMVVDWYYDEKGMQEIFNTVSNIDEDIDDIKVIKDEYYNIKHKLELLTVGNLLIELEEGDKVI